MESPGAPYLHHVLGNRRIYPGAHLIEQTRLRRSLVRWTALLLAVMFTVMAGTPVRAAAEDSSLVARVQAKYGEVVTMRANFTQVVTSELFGEEKSEGQVVLKRPQMMRWSFADEKQFITDGNTMWIYTKADKQVIKYEDIATQKGGTSADSLLGSLDKLDGLYTIEILTETETESVLALTPKNLDEAQFKAVKLTLDGELLVKGVVITDQFDNVTRLTFAEVELNPEVDDTKFQFTVPEGVEVIKAATN